MNQRFVIAVFVARAELQMAVQEEAKVVLEAREHDMLVARVASKDDFVGVDVVFGRGGDVPGLRHADAKSAHDDETRNAQTARGGKLIREKKSAP